MKSDQLTNLKIYKSIALLLFISLPIYTQADALSGLPYAIGFMTFTALLILTLFIIVITKYIKKQTIPNSIIYLCFLSFFLSILIHDEKLFYYISVLTTSLALWNVLGRCEKENHSILVFSIFQTFVLTLVMIIASISLSALFDNLEFLTIQIITHFLTIIIISSSIWFLLIKKGKLSSNWIINSIKIFSSLLLLKWVFGTISHYPNQIMIPLENILVVLISTVLPLYFSRNLRLKNSSSN